MLLPSYPPYLPTRPLAFFLFSLFFSLLSLALSLSLFPSFLSYLPVLQRLWFTFCYIPFVGHRGNPLLLRAHVITLGLPRKCSLAPLVHHQLISNLNYIQSPFCHGTGKQISWGPRLCLLQSPEYKSVVICLENSLNKWGKAWVFRHLLEIHMWVGAQFGWYRSLE